MKRTTWTVASAALLALTSTALVGLILGKSTPFSLAQTQQEVTRYVRFAVGDHISYGILDGEAVEELRDDLFAAPPSPIVGSGKTSGVAGAGMRYFHPTSTQHS